MTTAADAAHPPLRLLQVLEPSGGGSGRHFLDLCRGLKQRGHAVTAVYSPLRAEERFVSELRTIGLPSVMALPMRRAVGPWDLGAWRALTRLIAENGPFDLIHGHSSKAGALTRLRLPGPHVPRIYTPHAYRTMDPTLGRKGRLAYAAIEGILGRFLSDRIICVSRQEYDHALTLGIPAEKLRVVVNGVERPPEDQRAAMRAALGLSPDALVFGFVGRLSAQKAPERLIAAFARIASAIADASLVMIGSGELEPAIRARITDLGLADRVTLNAEIPGSAAMQAFDVLVMTSRYEAMSYVMLEAAVAARPMILTDVGGAATVLEPGRNGLLVANEDDPPALAEAMRAIADPVRRAAFEAEARTRRDCYSLEAMVDRTLDVYFEVLDRARPAG